MYSAALAFDVRTGKFPLFAKTFQIYIFFLELSIFVFYSSLNVQAVDHPYLVVYSQSAASRSGVMTNNGTVEQVCGICHEPVEDVVVSFYFLFFIFC